MEVIAYDFETTGVDPKTCEPLQVAASKVKIAEDGSTTTISTLKTYLKIEASSVPEGAYKIHGIDKQLTEMVGKDPFAVVPKISGVVLGYNNKRYDDIILTRYGGDIVDSIDLFVGTSRLKKQGILERASLSAAFEALTGEEALNAHDAQADVVMTLGLIKPMMGALGLNTFQDLVTYLSSPLGDVNMLMPFGKHKGTRLCDLPSSYVNWLKTSADLYGDLKASVALL